MASTTYSLLHSAVDLKNETKLDAELKSWLAFAAQKVHEVVAIAKAVEGRKDDEFFSANGAAQASRRNSPRVHNKAVKEAVSGVRFGSVWLGGSLRAECVWLGERGETDGVLLWVYWYAGRRSGGVGAQARDGGIESVGGAAEVPEPADPADDDDRVVPANAGAAEGSARGEE